MILGLGLTVLLKSLQGVDGMGDNGNVELIKDFEGAVIANFHVLVRVLVWHSPEETEEKPQDLQDSSEIRIGYSRNTSRMRHHCSNLLDSNLKHHLQHLSKSVPPPLHATNGLLVVISSMMTGLPSLNKTVKTALAGRVRCKG